jgi:hypothetical protein
MLKGSYGKEVQRDPMTKGTWWVSCCFLCPSCAKKTAAMRHSNYDRVNNVYILL